MSLKRSGVELDRFFGCIVLRREKRPYLFWTKNWGSITTASYSVRVVPLKGSLVLWEPGLHVMQHNTPLHKAGQTMQGLMDWIISPNEWPSYCSDLNPVESMWKFRKSTCSIIIKSCVNGGSVPERIKFQKSETGLGFRVRCEWVGESDGIDVPKIKNCIKYWWGICILLDTIRSNH